MKEYLVLTAMPTSSPSSSSLSGTDSSISCQDNDYCYSYYTCFFIANSYFCLLN